MEPLKEMFNEAYYKRLSDEVASVYKKFNKKAFYLKAIDALESRELNQRLRHTSSTLHEFLPQNYPSALNIIKQVAPEMPKGYTSLVFPDYVANYGLSDIDSSLNALKYFTPFGSSEFAIRHFIQRDQQTTLLKMLEWSYDKDEHVRRLASEGSRPRLPWSFKLDAIIKQPGLTKEILQNLRSDPSLYVRKSVANHLNDISKDNPAYMLSLVKSWDLQNPYTAWITKHACRTLIKKGNTDSLNIFSFEKEPQLQIKNFTLAADKLKLGQKLKFRFDLISRKNTDQKLVVDYLLHYARPAKENSVKVFKLKDVTLTPGSVLSLSGTRLLKDFTTRKHYSGMHKIQIQVNGKVMAETQFDLQV